MGRASFVVKRGVWGMFVVLVWRKIQLHQRNHFDDRIQCLNLVKIGLLLSVMVETVSNGGHFVMTN